MVQWVSHGHPQLEDSGIFRYWLSWGSGSYPNLVLFSHLLYVQDSVDPTPSQGLSQHFDSNLRTNMTSMIHFFCEQHEPLYCR